ncbi:MAG: primosomal protein N', partial [Spirochaetes bacterium]|nr:primosomal protein N' [Spirochaetota bacterium]
MVAKGLNFPGVQLVGVVLADTTLNLPDFRAAERAFALVTQVAGRAGRFSKGGRVIVQTYRPQSNVIQRAAAHDANGFYADELAVRRDLGFPPFARLIRLVLRSRDEQVADNAAAALAAELYRQQQADPETASAELLGPAECPIARMSGNARRQLLLRGPHLAALRRLLAAALQLWSPPGDCYCEIDVDPVSLM